MIRRETYRQRSRRLEEGVIESPIDYVGRAARANRSATGSTRSCITARHAGQLSINGPQFIGPLRSNVICFEQELPSQLTLKSEVPFLFVGSGELLLEDVVPRLRKQHREDFRITRNYG